MLFERLGREVYFLLQEGKLAPQIELQKPFQKILELDRQVEALEARLAAFPGSLLETNGMGEGAEGDPVSATGREDETS
jgi:hypothetical protein